MKIRNATISDLSTITDIESECFPPSEAANIKSFEKRLEIYPNHFWLMEIDGKIVSFINGMVTDEPTIRDEMFENANLHNENGMWQTIFGVDTLPAYRNKSFAAILMEQVISDSKKQGRKGCILTCKENLIQYYEKFGFVNEGISKSVHGSSVWYDMKLLF